MVRDVVEPGSSARVRGPVEVVNVAFETADTQRDGGLRTSLRTGLDAVRALRPEWEDLYRRSDLGNPNLHPSWALAWYETFVPNRDVIAVVVRKAGLLVGVACLWRNRTPVKWGRAHSLNLVGAGRFTLLTDTPGILTAPDLHRKVVAAVGKALGELGGWWWTTLSLAPAQGWSDALLGIDEAVVVPAIGRTSVLTPLPATAAEFVPGLKRNVRESIRRSVNRLNNSGRPWRVERLAAGDSEFLSAIDELVRLNRARAELAGRRHHADVFQDTRYRDFLRRLGGREGSSDLLTLYRLRVGGDVVASQLVADSPTQRMLITSGVSSAGWSYSPLALLIRELAVDSIDAGQTTLNHSPGPDQAKLRWSCELSTSHEFHLVRPNPLARSMFGAYATLAIQALALREFRRNKPSTD